MSHRYADSGVGRRMKSRRQARRGHKGGLVVAIAVLLFMMVGLVGWWMVDRGPGDGPLGTFASPESQRLNAATAWLDENVADPEYEIIRTKHGPDWLKIKFRHRAVLGFRITTYCFTFDDDGKVGSALVVRHPANNI